MSGSGSLMCEKEKLLKHSNKAYFPMSNALHKKDFEAIRSLHLFDSLIRPILNYNCEVWNQLLTLLPMGGGGGFLSHTTIVLAATLKPLKL